MKASEADAQTDSATAHPPGALEGEQPGGGCQGQASPGTDGTLAGRPLPSETVSPPFPGSPFLHMLLAGLRQKEDKQRLQPMHVRSVHILYPQPGRGGGLGGGRRAPWQGPPFRGQNPGLGLYWAEQCLPKIHLHPKETYREKGHMVREAEAGAVQLQAKEQQGLPANTGGRKRQGAPPLGPWREHGLTGPLTQTAGPQSNERIDFGCFKPPSCHRVCAAPGH